MGSDMSPVITRKGSDEKPKRTATSVWLPEETLERIGKVVGETKRSRNEVIVQLLEYALDAHEGKRSKK